MHPDTKAALAVAAQKALSRLAQNCPGLRWATVATKDGAEVASHGASADEKLSVMTGAARRHLAGRHRAGALRGHQGGGAAGFGGDHAADAAAVPQREPHLL